MTFQFSERPMTFERDSHRYTDDLGAVYTSVTTVVKHYTPPFDPTGEITERSAKKAGISADEQKRLWEKKGSDSRERGTRIHSLLEEYILDFPMPPFDFGTAEIDLCQSVMSNVPLWGVLNGTPYPKDPAGQAAFNERRAGISFHSEVLVADAELGLSGTIDFCITDGKRIVLYDWKTNAEVKRASFNGQRLYAPFSDWDNCDLFKYGLQMALYAIMLERQGWEIAGMVIVHIQDETPPAKIEKIVCEPSILQYLREPGVLDSVICGLKTKQSELPLVKTAEPINTGLTWDSMRAFIPELARQEAVRRFTQGAIDGKVNPLESYIIGDVLAKMGEEIKDKIKALALGETDKYTKADMNYRGVPFSVASHPVYYYDGCDEIKRNEERNKKLKELMQDSLKKNVEIIDSETGEVMPRATVWNSPYIKINYKKS